MVYALVIQYSHDISLLHSQVSGTNTGKMMAWDRCPNYGAFRGIHRPAEDYNLRQKSVVHEGERKGLFPDTYNCGLYMRRECRERFPRHQVQRKPLVSDPGMHYGMCVTHVLWCMSGSLTLGGGENVPGIPGACATRNFTYLVRGPWKER